MRIRSHSDENLFVWKMGFLLNCSPYFYRWLLDLFSLLQPLLVKASYDCFTARSHWPPLSSQSASNQCPVHVLVRTGSYLLISSLQLAPNCYKTICLVFLNASFIKRISIALRRKSPRCEFALLSEDDASLILFFPFIFSWNSNSVNVK